MMNSITWSGYNTSDSTAASVTAGYRCYNCGRSCNCTSANFTITYSTSSSPPAPRFINRRSQLLLRQLKRGERATAARMAHLDFVEARDALTREQERRRVRQLGTRPPKVKKGRGGRRYRNTKRGARPKRR